jgi:IS605 OrfB family transposase
VKANLGQREAEKSYGIAGDDLTPSLSWSLYSLRRDWNAAKDEVAPWWGECSKEAFNTGLDALARALKNWGDSRKGKRKGKPVCFPRFKSKRRARPSIRFWTGAIRCEERHAVLPRIGRVKLHENGRGLADLVAAGTARVLSVTVRLERGRWFASFTVETEVSRPAARLPDAVVGVDLGVKTLAVLSTGEQVPNPRHLSGALRKLRRLSRTASRRHGPDRRAGREPSNRWRRATAALGKAHGRVADQRKDGLHKLTTRLAAEFGTVVIDDLHVAGMMKNRRLARHVADASFGEFRRQVEYKAAWRGGRVIVADRWFASSKTCSGCGAVKAKLPLSERTYACDSCGLVLDRDVNAALNLAECGNRLIAGSGPEISNGRGADRKTGRAPAGGREASTRHRSSGSDRDVGGSGMRALSGNGSVEHSSATVLSGV